MTFINSIRPYRSWSMISLSLFICAATLWLGSCTLQAAGEGSSAEKLETTLLQRKTEQLTSPEQTPLTELAQTTTLENIPLSSFIRWSSEDSLDTYSVAWGDMNGDGYLDLAVGNISAPNKVYLNVNGILSTTAVWESVDTDDTSSVAWGDMNGDGLLDLAVGNIMTNKVYLNVNGTLSTTAVWESADSDNTRSVAWGDMNGDGDLDLAVGNKSTPNKVYLNVNGTLSTTAVWESVDTDDTSSVAWGDMNGDGLLDLAVGNIMTNKVYLYKDGALETTASWNSKDEQNTSSVAWGDMDGDGDLDLAVGNADQKNLIYINENGSLQREAVWESSDTDGTHGLAWGDMDGDGDLDLATANIRSINKVYMNEGGVLNINSVWESADSDDNRSVAWGDINGDGYLDLAVGNELTPNKVYLNVNGTLSTTAVWKSNDTDDTRSIAWGDMNGDGHLDLAVGNVGLWNDDCTCYISATNKVYLNVNGTLSTTASWESDESEATYSVAWGDMNGDSYLDLAVGNGSFEKGQRQLSRVYLNVKGILSTTPVWTSTVDDTRSVAWGDMDGDGDLDLAVGNYFYANKVYLNVNGALTETNSWTSADADKTLSVAWGDVDGDGDLDLAAGNFETVNKVYFNEGGVLQQAAGWSSLDGNNTYSVAWGDVDGDGDLDLAAGNTHDSNIVYLNENGILRTASDNPWMSNHIESENTYSVAWGDMDRDGDLDLATGTDKSHIRLYLNGHQGGVGVPYTNPILSVTRPITPPITNFYVPPQLITDPIISIAYTLSNKNVVPTGQIRAFYSLNGGGQWLPAVATTDTVTQNLATGSHVYRWDTFDSSFFGQSDNVVLRFVASAQPETGAMSGTYKYINQAAGPILYGTTSATTFPFRVRGTQIRVVDENDNAKTNAIVFYRPSEKTLQATLLTNDSGIPLKTNSEGFLEGRPAIDERGELIALWPVPDSELDELNRPDFTDNYTLFYTSKMITETNQSEFQNVSIQKDKVTQTLTISHENKLLLFHLNVSLEWDARNDPLFLLDLEESFQEASAILYDVTDGQVALGQINLFHNKAYWGNADVVIYADNSLRPSAAIGGIVTTPISETITNTQTTVPEIVSNAYGPGQVRMGTVWDTFGERTADLGEEWTRALAHELAHYLLFLPDNYLGIEEKVLQPVDCPNSYMTNNSDPDYSEFLPNDQVWQLSYDCEITLANQTTGRADWQTIRNFYSFLDMPITDAEILDGPAILPLAVTYVVPWAYDLDAEQEPLTLPGRNYFIRKSGENDQPIIRLPNAQVFLFKTLGTEKIADDLIIPLGSPTGGGNRIYIRGAEIGDRLCLIDATESFQGCEIISSSQASIAVTNVMTTWKPEIVIHSEDGITFEIEVFQDFTNINNFTNINKPGQLNAQIFPLHYRGIPNIEMSPINSFTSTNGLLHTATLTLPLPAYEIAVRVWITEGVSIPLEAVSILQIDPPNWNSKFNSTLISDTLKATQFITKYAPIFGPISTPTGGPISTPTGGPNNVPFSGPISTPTGGPISTPTGGPISTPTGGPLSFEGGARSAEEGARSAYTPILSSDAQVIIYNTEGFFEDNGILNLQQLPSVPEIETHEWLVPVGQAYHVESRDLTDTRFISFNYLQRDVPDGYEYTLKIYFLEDCAVSDPQCVRQWERISDTKIFPGNIVAAPLQTINQELGSKAANGTYAVMSTVEMPQMGPGWNLFAYPMPDCRSWDDALASIKDSIDKNGDDPFIIDARIGSSTPTDIPIEGKEMLKFEPGHVYWVRIKDGHTVIPYLSPPEHHPDGRIDNNCN